MGFTELNSVEHYIIHQMSGVNLNLNEVSELHGQYGIQWQYKSPDELGRGVNEVLVESEFVKALVRLNPEIEANASLAD
ncbi:MAG: hypothetical protein HRT68_15315, partial [Flavobacteriaceae bacterium]|nr:hypothetical protein [Flavobacteriaceae bacterium]